MNLPDGTLLQGGKYKIVRHISSGGFGNTYVTKDEELEIESEGKIIHVMPLWKWLLNM